MKCKYGSYKAVRLVCLSCLLVLFLIPKKDAVEHIWVVSLVF